VNFEYQILDSKMFDRKHRALEDEMNQLGGDGWEMVAACGVHNQVFVFMRTTTPPKKVRAKVKEAEA
jgi:hypothetical protein